MCSCSLAKEVATRYASNFAAVFAALLWEEVSPTVVTTAEAFAATTLGEELSWGEAALFAHTPAAQHLPLLV